MSTADKKGDPMTETLSKAWSLFDAGNYTEAEALYKDCYAKTPSTDHDHYSVEEVQELLKNISSVS